MNIYLVHSYELNGNNEYDDFFQSPFPRYKDANEYILATISEYGEDGLPLPIRWIIKEYEPGKNFATSIAWFNSEGKAIYNSDLASEFTTPKFKKNEVVFLFQENCYGIIVHTPEETDAADEHVYYILTDLENDEDHNHSFEYMIMSLSEVPEEFTLPKEELDKWTTHYENFCRKYNIYE